MNKLILTATSSILLTSATLSCLSSCSGGGSKPDAERVEMQCEVMRPDSLIGLPINTYAISDTAILINDCFVSPYVSKYDTRTWQKIAATAARGVGPGEVLAPIKIAVSEDSLYVLSLSSKDVLAAGLDSLKLTKRAKLQLEAMGLFYLPGLKMFVAPLLHIGNREIEKEAVAYVYDRNFNKIQTIAGYPRLWAGEAELSDNVLGMFHQVYGVAEIDNNRMVMADPHVLRFYRFENGQMIHEKDIEMSPYEYDHEDASEANVLGSARLRKGFEYGGFGLAVHDGMIYVAANEALKSEAQESKIVMRVYDFEGNLKKVIVPDVDLQMATMTITPAGEMIMFTSGEEVYPAVGRIP